MCALPQCADRRTDGWADRGRDARVETPLRETCDDWMLSEKKNSPTRSIRASPLLPLLETNHRTSACSRRRLRRVRHVTHARCPFPRSRRRSRDDGDDILHRDELPLGSVSELHVRAGEAVHQHLVPALTPFTSAPMDATLPVMDEPGPVLVSAEERRMPPEVVVSASSAMADARSGGLQVLHVQSGVHRDGAAAARVNRGLARGDLCVIVIVIAGRR